MNAQFAPLLELAALPLGAMSACTVGARELRLMCPLHGAVFDVRDGRVLAPPATCPLQTYPLRVLGGVIEVELTQPS